MIELTPKRVVAELDNYVIGQDRAKRAIAVAVRNRWRRAQIPSDYRDEVTPKNILLIGPTGVGKTEIARRLAGMTGAPFVRVEASKYTEVGYHGRDVESIVRDLVKQAVAMVRHEHEGKILDSARKNAEEKLLGYLVHDALINSERYGFDLEGLEVVGDSSRSREAALRRHLQQKLRPKLASGELDDHDVEITAPVSTEAMAHVFSAMGGEEVGIEFQKALERMMPRRTELRRMRVSEARKMFEAEEAEKLVDKEGTAREGLIRAQELGIVFLDEIDKLVATGEGEGPDVSREGVQRDLLPLVEGCSVTTRFGAVRTDHILFIGAGSFSRVSPADLIPELQGRFPLRVTLDALSKEDFINILVRPRNALTTQYQAMLQTEGIELDFQPEAITRIAEAAWKANNSGTDIGARRLHTVMERLLEDVLFEAPDLKQKKVVIDWMTVESKIDTILADEVRMRTEL